MAERAAGSTDGQRGRRRAQECERSTAMPATATPASVPRSNAQTNGMDLRQIPWRDRVRATLGEPLKPFKEALLVCTLVSPVASHALQGMRPNASKNRQSLEDPSRSQSLTAA